MAGYARGNDSIERPLTPLQQEPFLNRSNEQRAQRDVVMSTTFSCNSRVTGKKHYTRGGATPVGNCPLQGTADEHLSLSILHCN